LGADSLSLVSLISGIHKEFGIIVPFVEIYKSPTIGDLEKYINNAQKSEYTSIQHVEEQEYYPMSSAQRRLYTLNIIGRCWSGV